MEDTQTPYIYAAPVIDFMTVAVQTCLFLEHIPELSKEEFLDKAGKLLPLLYLRTRLLTPPETQGERENEAFVTENDYEAIRCAVRQLLGEDDVYVDVFEEDGRYSDEIVTAYISEHLADVYQELKDLAASYQTENEIVMNDALAACLEGFEEHWGQKLLNVLRPLHSLWLLQKQAEPMEDECEDEHLGACTCSHHDHECHCSDDHDHTHC